jgi:hypothetical protein
LKVRVYVNLTDLQSRKIAAEDKKNEQHVPIKIWDLVRPGRSLYYELLRKDFNSCDVVRNKCVTHMWNQAMITPFPFLKVGLDFP